MSAKDIRSACSTPLRRSSVLKTPKTAIIQNYDRSKRQVVFDFKQVVILRSFAALVEALEGAGFAFMAGGRDY